VPHIVPLPHDSRYTLWDSLAGRSLPDLEAVLPVSPAFGAGPDEEPAAAVVHARD